MCGIFVCVNYFFDEDGILRVVEFLYYCGLDGLGVYFDLEVGVGLGYM